MVPNPNPKTNLCGTLAPATWTIAAAIFNTEILLFASALGRGKRLKWWGFVDIFLATT